MEGQTKPTSKLKFVESKRKVKVDNKITQPHHKLITVANNHNLTLIASEENCIKCIETSQLLDFTSNQAQVINQAAAPLVSLTFRPTLISVARYGYSSLLLIAGANSNSFQRCPIVEAFDLDTRTTIGQVTLSDLGVCEIVDYAWHPNYFDSLVALCTSDGRLLVLAINKQTKSMGVVYNEQNGAITCCWSMKGKNLAVGTQRGHIFRLEPLIGEGTFSFKQVNGSYITFENSKVTPDHQLVRLRWINAKYLVSTHARPNNPGSLDTIYSILTVKPGKPFLYWTNLNFESQPAINYVVHIANLSNSVVCISSATGEAAAIGVMGANEAATNELNDWTALSIEAEGGRIELPLDSNNGETHPSGLTMTTWPQDGRPILIFYTNDGLICSYAVMHDDKILKFPEHLNQPEQKFAYVSTNPTATAPPAAAAAPKNPFSASPSFGGKAAFYQPTSSLSVFGSSFLNNSATSGSAFAQTSTQSQAPAFALASTPASTQPPVPASTPAPAFAKTSTPAFASTSPLSVFGSSFLTGATTPTLGSAPSFTPGPASTMTSAFTKTPATTSTPAFATSSPLTFTQTSTPAFASTLTSTFAPTTAPTFAPTATSTFAPTTTPTFASTTAPAFAQTTASSFTTNSTMFAKTATSALAQATTPAFVTTSKPTSSATPTFTLTTTSSSLFSSNNTSIFAPTSTPALATTTAPAFAQSSAPTLSPAFAPASTTVATPAFATNSPLSFANISAPTFSLTSKSTPTPVSSQTLASVPPPAPTPAPAATSAQAPTPVFDLAKPVAEMTEKIHKAREKLEFNEAYISLFEEMNHLRDRFDEIFDLHQVHHDAIASLKDEISQLDLQVLENFYLIEYVKSRISCDIKKKSIDPITIKKVNTIKMKLKQIESKLEELNDHVDVAWEDFVRRRSKKERHVLSPDAIYKALATNQKIIKVLKSKIKTEPEKVPGVKKSPAVTRVEEDHSKFQEFLASRSVVPVRKPIHTTD